MGTATQLGTANNAMANVDAYGRTRKDRDSLIGDSAVRSGAENLLAHTRIATLIIVGIAWAAMRRTIIGKLFDCYEDQIDTLSLTEQEYLEGLLTDANKWVNTHYPEFVPFMARVVAAVEWGVDFEYVKGRLESGDTNDATAKAAGVLNDLAPTAVEGFLRRASGAVAFIGRMANMSREKDAEGKPIRLFSAKQVHEARQWLRKKGIDALMHGIPFDAYDLATYLHEATGLAFTVRVNKAGVVNASIPKTPVEAEQPAAITRLKAWAVAKAATLTPGIEPGTLFIIGLMSDDILAGVAQAEALGLSATVVENTVRVAVPAN